MLGGTPFLLELISQGKIMFKYGCRRISIVEADRLSKVVLNLFFIKLFQMLNRKLFFRFDLSRSELPKSPGRAPNAPQMEQRTASPPNISIFVFFFPGYIGPIGIPKRHFRASLADCRPSPTYCNS